ncbi:hypothetical protein A1O1_08276 [Capronia coronata CBS 617.96]|uniref:Uncharacterized protein n=1 Tax=Capronia coronata CBS 617.96 TaxID=1182541 RepID=W9YCS4_9EURO|nr:uncharacterized protein A1O1_08276 [Capronia coronata CBS 617.96]EXJ80134.1 hypothetical protein A1O1_08276 [Capronia coronata CBS 617.96]
MLDENLPTFLIKPSKDKPRQASTLLFSQHGAEFEPAYTLRHLDPEQHASRNRYAAALYDAFTPDVLYAEVLLIPEWTQPAPLSEQAKLNGAIPPPPEPILPTEFTIQLYNPDQQVTVRHKAASWNTAASWRFELPQQTFRTPSSSALDRGQHDPAASELTPKIGFKWKKDSKFSKDLACFLSGKSTAVEGSKAKNKEPDITVSIFKGLREITLYEPNLQRMDIEDLKGFEVVLLLGAMVIRDVYFGSLRETFNIPSAAKKSNPTSPILSDVSSTPDSFPLPISPNKVNYQQAGRDPRVPPTDPRTQWEIDVETARLRKQAADEERARRRRAEEEERLTKQLLEQEEKEQRQRRQAEIDRETQRLQQMYGQAGTSSQPNLPPRDSHQQRHHSDSRQSAYVQSQQNPHFSTFHTNAWNGYPVGAQANAPYMSGAASQSSFLGSVSPTAQHSLKQKSSIFSFRRRSDHDANKLQRKRSAVF